MKLDESVVKKIMADFFHNFYHGQWGRRTSSEQMRKSLETLDLVIKSGDSSQGTLVENK